jgi:hypothetical protein
VSIRGGLDVHRRQITLDWVDHDSGEARRGRIAPATRAALRAWLGELPCPDGAFAVEGAPAGGWGRGAAGGRVGRAPGRAGRDQQPARAQAAGQDRPRRRQAAMGAAGAAAAGLLVDPTGVDRGPAPHRAAAQDPGRPGHRLATTHPRRAVPPRAPPPHPSAAVTGTHGWLERVALAPASRQLLGWRCARSTGWTPSWPRPTRGWHPGPPPAGLPGADRQPLRDRGHHRPDDPGRAGRCPPVWRRRPGGAGTGLDITVDACDGKRSPGICRARARRCCAGRCLRPPRPPPAPAPPTTPTTSRSRPARAATGPAWRWRASSSAGCATPWGAWATPRSPRPGPARGGLTEMAGGCPAHSQADVPRPAPAGPLPPRPVRGRPQKTARPRTGTPIGHLVAGP